MLQLLQAVIALSSTTSRRVPMLQEILGDEAGPFRRANDCLQRGPLRFELLLVVKSIAFVSFLKTRIKLRPSGEGKAQPCEAAFVITRHAGPLLRRALGVVNADVILSGAQRAGPPRPD